MSEFSEVMKQWNRMCDSIPCQDCDIFKNGLRSVCQGRYNNSKEIETMEKIIMQWAEKHPELVYPTWAEWLEQFGLVTDVIDGRCGTFLYNAAAQPIPADKAQKLGIKPKEG